MDITIEQGEIITNSAWFHIQHDDFAVVYVDTGSKRPDVDVQRGDGVVILYLLADQNTLNVNKDLECIPSKVIIPVTGRWDAIAETGRYTVRAALWKEKTL